MAKTTKTTDTAKAGTARIGAPRTDRMVEERDPLQSYPTAVPGKEGSADRNTISFIEGDVLAGEYVLSKKCISENFLGNKRDENGDKYRMLHVLRDGSGMKFGLWGVGQLDLVLPSLRVGQYIEVEYLGVAEKPLKAGQNPPHLFKFRSDEDIIVDTDSALSADNWEELPEATPGVIQGAAATQAAATTPASARRF